MENGKNGHSSPKMRPRVKLPITDPLKFGSPVFWVSTEMQNWCRLLQKMGKMAIAPQKCVQERNFQLPTPLKFGSPVFWVSTETQNWCQPLRTMGKMAVASQKPHNRAKLPITDPLLKFGSPVFWVSTETQNWCQPLRKMGKMGHSSPKKRVPRVKLPITDPIKVWVSGFLSVNGNAKLVSAITENGKNGHSSPKMSP